MRSCTKQTLGFAGPRGETTIFHKWGVVLIAAVALSLTGCLNGAQIGGFDTSSGSPDGFSDPHVFSGSSSSLLGLPLTTEFTSLPGPGSLFVSSKSTTTLTLAQAEQPSSVPEPGTAVLLTTGLAAIAGLRYRSARRP